MTLEKEKKKNNLQKIFEVIKTMASKPSGLIGLSILLFHVIIAITSPLYVPYDYKAIDPTLMLQAPSSDYWFLIEYLDSAKTKKQFREHFTLKR